MKTAMSVISLPYKLVFQMRVNRAKPHECSAPWNVCQPCSTASRQVGLHIPMCPSSAFRLLDYKGRYGALQVQLRLLTTQSYIVYKLLQLVGNGI